jgi:beta-N-acetylhexosaminidase
MTAHVLMTALDDERPATLSRRVIDGLLRRELGFNGVVVSDDLEMKGISGQRGLGEAAVAAVQAGCDVLLICSGDIDRNAAVLEALIHAVEAGALPIGRVEDALARQRRAKERFLELEAGGIRPSPLRGEWRPQSARPLSSILGCEDHQAVADEMARFV